MMIQKLRDMMKNEKGFTLIEIMLVVIILGILAAIAIPRFSNQSDTAKENKAKADMKTYANALELYYFDYDQYPADLDDLVDDDNAYMKNISNDPWDNAYEYSVSDGEYDLYSLGSDGVVDTPDDGDDTNDDDIALY